MLRTRFTQAVGAVLVGGVAFAALTPLLPFQEPVKPDPEHRKVLAGVGEWEGSVIMNVPGMDEPMEMPCKESIKAIGDFWTTSEFTGNFGGMPFNGASTLGYDPVKKKFVGTWIDNQHPYMAMMEGDWDAEKNAIVLHYDMYDTMSGSFLKMRNETVHADGKYVITFFQLSDEGESEMMRIEMTKKVGEAVEAGSGR